MGDKLELKDLIQPEEMKNDSNSVTDLINLQVAKKTKKNIKIIIFIIIIMVVIKWLIN